MEAVLDKVPAGQAHRTLYRSDAFYAAHPHAAALSPDVWLLVFNRARRRAIILHPPQDPDFQNVLMRSEDAGAAWSAPRAVPGEDWRGTECAVPPPGGGSGRTGLAPHETSTSANSVRSPSVT